MHQCFCVEVIIRIRSAIMIYTRGFGNYDAVFLAEEVFAKGIGVETSDDAFAVVELSVRLVGCEGVEEV